MSVYRAELLFLYMLQSRQEKSIKNECWHGTKGIAFSPTCPSDTFLGLIKAVKAKTNYTGGRRASGSVICITVLKAVRSPSGWRIPIGCTVRTQKHLHFYKLFKV